MDSDDPAQGWASNDRISPTGPGLCVDVQAFKDVFKVEEKKESKISRTNARKKSEDQKNPSVICRFQCMAKKKKKFSLSTSKSEPCMDQSGRRVDVRVGPIPRGECVLSKFNPMRLTKNSEMETTAMQACAKFTEKKGKATGVQDSCGYRVELLGEMADKEENWTDELNGAGYRSVENVRLSAGSKPPTTKVASPVKLKKD